MALSSTTTTPSFGPSILSPMPPFPTILFDPANTDSKSMFQAYCLNPPPESCEFGSCPNPDVTGIGQQASIYVTSIAFVISLIYCPQLIRPMLYTHLGLIYSLLIATVISASLGQLTQNDAIFVLVTVASPGSFAIWVLTLWSLWHPSRFPVRKSKRKSWEILLLKLSCLGSLIFEIVMVCVIFIPSSGLDFSQPACNKRYSGRLWVELLWELPYLVQAIWMIHMIIGLGFILRKKIERLSLWTAEPTSAEHEWLAWRHEAQPDVVTWVEASLARMTRLATPARSVTMRSILAAIQLCAIPNIGFILNQNIFVSALLVIAPIFDNSSGNAKRSIIFLRRSLFGMIASVAIGCNLIYSIFPTCSDAVLIILCIFIYWKRFYFAGIQPKYVRLAKLCFILYFFVIALGGSFVSRLLSTNSLAQRTNLDNSLDLSAQPLFLNYFALPLWFLAWLSTSVWPTGVVLAYEDIWKATMSRAHILKAALLVVAPNSLWIQASVAANPTKSTDMTFGQIFALIVSVVTIISLLDVARDVKRDTWKAFFFSERIPVDQEDAALDPPGCRQLPAFDSSTTVPNSSTAATT